MIASRKLVALCLAIILIPIAIGQLVSCTTNTPPTSAQIIADISGALDAAGKTIPALAATTPPSLTPAQASALSGDVVQAKALLASIGPGTPAQTGATTLAKVSGYLNAVLSSLAAMTLPEPYALIVAAANVIAQEVETYLASFAPVPPTPAVTASVAKSGMSLTEARTDLHVVTHAP